MTLPAGAPAEPTSGEAVLVVVGSREPVTPISLGTITAGTLAIARAVRLYGWAVKETTGTAAAGLSIYNGVSNAAELVVPITLAINESTRDWLPEPGILCQAGVFVDVDAGSVKPVLWVKLCSREGY